MIRGGSSLFHPPVNSDKAKTDYNLITLATAKPGAVQLMFARCTITALIVIAWLTNAARSQDAVDAKGVLRQLCEQNLRITTVGLNAEATIRFEFRRSNAAKSGDLNAIRIVVEGSREGVRALFLTDAGLPYAHLGNGQLTALQLDAPQKLDVVAGIGLKCRFTSIAELDRAIVATNHPEKSTIDVNFVPIMREVAAEAIKIDYDASTRTLLLTKNNGSTLLIRLHRHTPAGGHLHISRLELRNSAGEGIVFVGMRSTSEAHMPSVVEKPPDGRQVLFSTTTGTSRVEQLFDSERVNLALRGKGESRIAELVVPIGGARNSELCAIDKRIGELQKYQQANFDPKDWDNWYADVCAFIIEFAVTPASESRSGQKRELFPGYSRTDAFCELSARIGHLRAHLLHKALCEVIRDDHADPVLRVMCLEILGAAGAPEGSSIFSQLRELRFADNMPHLRTGVASVLARADMHSRDDVARLREAALSSTSPPEVRYISVEALLLTDQTQGMTDLIRTLILSEAFRATDFPQRLIFAAGCSPEGREVLTELTATRASWPARTTLQRLLDASRDN